MNYRGKHTIGAIFGLAMLVVQAAFGQVVVTLEALYMNVESGTIVDINDDITFTTNGADSNFENDGTLQVAGDWQNNNTGGEDFSGTADATGTVEFDGTAAAQSVGGSQASIFENLTINNTFGTSPEITLDEVLTTYYTFTMTAGNINNAGYKVTIGKDASDIGTLAYTDGWIYGTGALRRWKGSAVIAIGVVSGHFPLGSVSYYRPFFCANTTPFGATGWIEVTHKGPEPSWHSDVDFVDPSWSGGTTVDNVSTAFWTVLTGGGLLGGTISLRFGGTGFGVIAATTDLNACLFSSVVGTFAATTGTVADPRVNRTGLTLDEFDNTGASQNFYIGSKDKSASPLPVSLVHFSAQPYDGMVELNWITASEVNNDLFVVERSNDKNSFVYLDETKGAGNSGEVLNYHLNDDFPYQGTSYYRLRQVDFDGTEQLSDVVSVFISDKTEPVVTVFPNPIEGNVFNLGFSGIEDEVLIVVTDQLGKEYYSKVVVIENSLGQFTAVDPGRRLPKGLYFVTASSNHKIYRQPLVVQ